MSNDRLKTTRRVILFFVLKIHSHERYRIIFPPYIHHIQFSSGTRMGPTFVKLLIDCNTVYSLDHPKNRLLFIFQFQQKKRTFFRKDEYTKYNLIYMQ